MQRYMRAMSNGNTIQSHNEPIPMADLMRVVPSVFADTAHDSRSDRFQVIPTATVLRGLSNEGFDPFFATQARTRTEGKAEFTKHMLRLRHRSLANDAGQAFEIILVNANDGTSSYQMIPGFFRFVCANGLFTGDTFEGVKVRHSGNAVHDVIEGAYRVLEDAPKVTAQVSEFKAIQLSPGARDAMADAAHQIRFPSAYEGAGAISDKAPITAETLLRPRRSDDLGHDLWSTFNVIQENAVKGGQQGYTRNEDGRRRRASVRAVGGIDQSRNLNRALWTLTETMAKLIR